MTNLRDYVYVSIHDANIRFWAEAVFIGTDISFRLLQTIYNESALSKKSLILNNNERQKLNKI